MRLLPHFLLVLAVLAVGLACRQASTTTANMAVTEADTDAGENDEPGDEIDPSILDRLRTEKWVGDIDGMVQRRYIRALVLYNRPGFFYDGPQPRGTAYEALKEFEKFLNRKLNTGKQPVHMVFIPVTREEMLKRMSDGRGDIAAGNLPIVKDLTDRWDFSDPVRTGGKEVIVTGPTAPAINSLEDLSGKKIFVRKQSRYWPNLVKLNEQFKQSGRSELILTEADPNLEDEDVLELVNSGVAEVTVVDDLVATVWSNVMRGLVVHNDLSLPVEDNIGWGVQRGTPKFLTLMNEFVNAHKQGTSFGNTLVMKYFKSTDFIRNNTAPSEIEKFKPAVAYFKKYAAEYNFDWLMIAAQAYQESQIDQSRRSPAGAVGVMQIKPSTAADKSVGITDVETNMQNNIHAGVKYLNYIMETNFKDAKLDSIDRGLFAFACYNAGPARVLKLQQMAEREGLDPNRWFNNVEVIAAREIGAETVTYVSNIYKYYIGYKMVADEVMPKRKAR